MVSDAFCAQSPISDNCLAPSPLQRGRPQGSYCDPSPFGSQLRGVPGWSISPSQLLSTRSPTRPWECTSLWRTWGLKTTEMWGEAGAKPERWVNSSSAMGLEWREQAEGAGLRRECTETQRIRGKKPHGPGERDHVCSWLLSLWGPSTHTASRALFAHDIV